MTPEQLQQYQEFYDTYFYYIIIGRLVLGLLFGLVPLVLGIKKGKRNLGIISFLVCGLVGAFSPPIGLIVAVIFTVIIIVKSKAKAPVISEDAADTGSPE